MASYGRRGAIKLGYHIATSLPAGIVIYLWLKSLPAAIATFVVGVFLDLDHFPDYLASCPTKPLSLKEFFVTCNEVRLPRLSLVLHSYELIPLLFLAGRSTGWNDVTVGITVGFTLHLISDQIVNRHKLDCKPLFYFFTYRLIKNFRREFLISRRYDFLHSGNARKPHK